MESATPAGGGSEEISPSDARNALNALAADRAALADRIRTPRWYYPALGAITAAFVASPAASATVRSTMVTFGCLALVFLITAYKKATGFSVSGDVGPRSRVRLILLAAVVVLLFVASMVLVATGNAVWVAGTAASTFLVMALGGRWYDGAYNHELRHGR